jgi:hypothetical protein
MLDRSTDRLRRRGAAVKNLAHSASLHSSVKSAPSNPGIKHLDGFTNLDEVGHWVVNRQRNA